MSITTKMRHYTYTHHRGQYLQAPAPPKIQTAGGEKFFVNMRHEMTYSLEDPDDPNGQNCSNEYNSNLDNCIINVNFHLTFNTQHTIS